MSGDVFGNGMLLSKHIKLVAAFDHRHVFIDPDPDPAPQLAGAGHGCSRCRGRAGPTTTPSLISDGGGVFPRTAKSITDHARRCAAALGIAKRRRGADPGRVDQRLPEGAGRPAVERRHRHLRQGDDRDQRRGRRQGQRRAAGRRLRAAGASCVGEGGNLGLTQLRPDRVRDASGGRINTDFIDNSAGVDTSDHEVNIKILLAGEVAAGRLTRPTGTRSSRR